MSATYVDLDRRHFTRVRGPVTIIGTWTVEEDGTQRPCLALIRTGEELSQHTQPGIVPVETAWMWEPAVAKDIDGAPQKAARASVGFARLLRLGDDPRDAISLALLINDHLDDLMTIPPAPPLDDDGETIAEAAIMIDGVVVHETELRH